MYIYFEQYTKAFIHSVYLVAAYVLLPLLEYNCNKICIHFLLYIIEDYIQRSKTWCAYLEIEYGVTKLMYPWI